MNPKRRPALSRTMLSINAHANFRRGLTILCLWGATIAVQAQPSATPSLPPASSAQTVENSRLDAPLLYQLLLGEMQVRSGDPGAGYSLILDAARKQRDPLLYRRAVELALQARSGEAALTAARSWAQDLPEPVEPHRFVLQILLALNRAGEAGMPLKAIVDRSTAAERNDTINAIPQIFARVTDKLLALTVVREALGTQLKQPEHAAVAWTTIGRMQLAAEQLPQALSAARQGQAADLSSPYPALLALELLQRGQTEAESIVQAQLRQAPQPDPAVALAYARLLQDLQRPADARQLLQRLISQQPKLPEPWLLLATQQVQAGALSEATASLQEFISLARLSEDERTRRSLTQAYLLMAQVAEKQKDFAVANAWLDRIENAEDIMAAQMRRASLLAGQGQMTQARALLRNQPERRPDDARLKLAAEAQLLRDFKSWQQAYEVYGEAVARFPQDAELLYDQAMMAEKAGRPDDMERLLRQLISSKPDHHHAYNALGYALADRGERLPEAKQLIEKAVALAPGDAYIQDSLGWVEFRMGNTARALAILQAAYNKRPDVEIAAHLGEVLWVSGQREQAQKIWREGLLTASDNEVLRETLKRFQIQP